MASLPPWLSSFPSLTQSVPLEQVPSLDYDQPSARCQTYTGASSSSSSLSSIGSAGSICPSKQSLDSNPFHYNAVCLPAKAAHRPANKHEQRRPTAESLSPTDLVRSKPQSQAVQHPERPLPNFQRRPQPLLKQKLQSVCSQRCSYTPYGPHPENIRLDRSDEEHIRALFIADGLQVCFAFAKREEERIPLQVTSRLPVASRDGLQSRGKQAGKRPATAGPVTTTATASATAQTTSAAPQLEQQPKPNANVEPPVKKQKTSYVSTKTKVPTSIPATSKAAPQDADSETLGLPPPKLILLKRKHTAKEEIARRIASFLCERDALMFAKSSMQVYAALDHLWWKATFGAGQAATTKQQQQQQRLASLWPCSNGWCDNCEQYDMQIILHDPTMARLCATCAQNPAFEVVGFNVARGVYRLSRTALHLLRYLPTCKAPNSRAAKAFWPPHLLWLAAKTAGQ